MSHTQLILSVALGAAMSAAACVTPPQPGGDDPGIDPPGGDDPGGDDPGGDDPQPPADPAVRALFDDGVAPVVSAKCAGCHGGPGTSPLKFVPASLATMYDVVV